MMNIDWDLVVRAIGLFTGFQLVILVPLMIREKKYFLAGLGGIYVAWYLRKFFWGIFSGNILYMLFIGGGQELFIPPTIYLMVYAICEGGVPRKKLFHYLPSAAFYGVFMCLRLFLSKEEYNSIQNDYFFVVYVFYLISLALFYGYYSYILFRKHKNELVRKVFLKYSVLFWLIVPHFILSSLTSIVGISHQLNIAFLEVFRDGWFMNVLYTITYALSFIQGVYLVIVMLSELSIFKKFQSPKNVQKSKPQQVLIERNLSEETEKMELYKQQDISIETVARELKISKSRLSEYLREEEGDTFNQFINQLRIEDFKRMIVQPENDKYDLVAIAQMAGFKSKATFNRVFKDLEGITPSEYKRRNIKVNQS